MARNWAQSHRPIAHLSEHVGYSDFPIDTLFQGSEALIELQNEVEAYYRAIKACQEPMKLIGVKHLLLTDADFHKKPHTLGVLTHPRILASVANYLGTMPVLARAKLVLTPARPENVGTRIKSADASQVFHIDFEDTRQVKLFVNVSNVSSDDGGMVAVSAGRSIELEGRYPNVLNAKRAPLLNKEILKLKELGKVRHFAPGAGAMPLD